MSPRGSAAHLRGGAERGSGQGRCIGSTQAVPTRPGELFPSFPGVRTDASRGAVSAVRRDQKTLDTRRPESDISGEVCGPSSNGPRSTSGSSSAVEHHLAKVRVAGSSPVSRPRTWRHSQVAKARDCKSSIAGSNPAAALFSSKFPTLPTLKTAFDRRHPHRKRPVSRPSFHDHSACPSASGERRRLAGHSSLQRPMLRSTLTIDQSIKTI